MAAHVPVLTDTSIFIISLAQIVIFHVLNATTIPRVAASHALNQISDTYSMVSAFVLLSTKIWELKYVTKSSVTPLVNVVREEPTTPAWTVIALYKKEN